jgi:hypothetical protein
MTESGYLTAVSALAPDDVWAVGHTFTGEGAQTLTMHWDGAQWSVVPSPNSSEYQFQDYLTGVTAVSANDVWAVGYDRAPSQNYYYLETLILHWDGTSWQVVDSPNGQDLNDNYLTSVSAVSTNDIWAVGYYESPGQYKPLTLHWDGTAWSMVDVAVNSGGFYYLYSVSAYSASDVWAVGRDMDSEDSTFTFAIRWDGTAWSHVSPALPSAYINQLNGVQALSPTDVWAVGIHGTDPSGLNTQTLALHWNGTSWAVVPSANGADGANSLNSVASSSTGELWSVGSYGTSGVTYALTLRYPTDGCVTPTISATATPVILPSRTPAPTNTASCGLDWRVAQSANTLDPTNYLRKVGMISEDDIWAVGTSLQHWDGTAWTLVPDGPSGWDVSGTAPDDIWVVGTEEGGHDSFGNMVREQGKDGGDAIRVPLPEPTSLPGYRTLVYHWDGTQWTRIPSPNPDGFYNFLTNVVAIAPDDAWAVGSFGAPEQTLALHWDGQAWTYVPSPSIPGSVTVVQSVHANSTDDVWAAGYYWDSQLLRNQYFIMRWDGTQWTTNYAPPGDPGANRTLFDIGGTDPGDMWAVGSSIMHWDGTQWTETPSPVADSELHGIVALAPNDAWIVGSTGNYLTQTEETVVLHWDGAQWSRVSSPNPDPYRSSLSGVTAESPTSVWAVGYTGEGLNGGISRTLIEHYSDPCASPTATPTPNGSVTATRTRTPTMTATTPPTQTQTPTYTPSVPPTHTVIQSPTPPATGTPSTVPSATIEATETPTGTPTVSATGTATATATDTPLAPTNTATSIAGTYTATPTACSIQFADALPGSTFYAYVHCLACLGIVNGYPCGGEGEPCGSNNDPYFRPGSPVTRGQLAKIVSNAAGFSEVHSEQSFEDVAVGSTFHDFIERLASRGIINGYPCGGEGEPCGGGNLPYFRPSANVTRGQTSKIVAIADALPTPPAGQQSFEDVAEGSTFWTWVESLAGIGAINGYPCGGVGEPCGPASRPYFRPGADVTRGQASKIVSNTFFPDCQTP